MAGKTIKSTAAYDKLRGDLSLVIFCDPVDFIKALLKPGNDLLAVGVYSRGYPHVFI